LHSQNMHTNPQDKAR